MSSRSPSTGWLLGRGAAQRTGRREALAVERFAFCPDETGDDPQDLPDYAKRLVGARTWSCHRD
ncbi:hypothetical protein [Streptomyces herbicida]|uniref:hypothetical protein n=1 Tax=Streptomyces herbicida TaxID=3065675 RepID=UPI0038CD8ABE